MGYQNAYGCVLAKKSAWNVVAARRDAPTSLSTQSSTFAPFSTAARTSRLSSARPAPLGMSLNALIASKKVRVIPKDL